LPPTRIIYLWRDVISDRTVVSASGRNGCLLERLEVPANSRSIGATLPYAHARTCTYIIRRVEPASNEHVTTTHLSAQLT
jgi:hypothetical protein